MPERIAIAGHNMGAWFTPFCLGAASAARSLDASLIVHCTDRSTPWAFDLPPVSGVLTMLTPASTEVIMGSSWGFAPRISLEMMHNAHAEVGFDQVSGVRTAIEHLFHHGHRRIAYLSPASPFAGDARMDVKLRYDGYLNGLTSARLPFDPGLAVFGDGPHRNHIDFGRDLAERLLASGVKFTAIMAWNDEVGIGAIQALEAAGRRVPSDVAVVGFDNFDPGRQTDPPLTSVALPSFEIGYVGATKLIRQIRGEQVAEEPQLIPMQLVVRGSCGCAPAPTRQFPVGADEFAATAHALFTHPRDISSESVNDLARRLHEAVTGGSHLVDAILSVIPTAASMGLDPYYAHAVGHLLRERIGREMSPLQQHEQARQLGIRESRRYLNFKNNVQEQFSWTFLGLRNAARVLPAPEKLGELVQSCVIRAGLTFFALGLRWEGDNAGVEVWRWRKEDGPEVRREMMPIADFHPEVALPTGRHTARVFELSGWSGELGILIVDGDSPFLHVQDEFAKLLSTVLESCRVHRTLQSANAKLKAAKEAAEAATRSKSAFLASMSHELRTPMTSILGYAEIIAQANLPEDERLRHVDTIRRNGKHLLALLNDILDLSKVEAGKMTIERIEMSLPDLLRDIDQIIRPCAAGKSVDWAINFRTPVPSRVSADPTRLRQILLNLTSNAMKFTSAGSAEMSVSLEGHQLRFNISDTGIGLTSQQQQALFEPFQQGDATTNRRFGGTGLGLVISRRLARLMGGDIAVSSVAGQGTTFSIVLPVQVAPGCTFMDKWEQNEAALTNAHAPAPAVSLSGRVLIAEDGEDNRELICHILTSAGLEVDVAVDGQEAVEKVGKQWHAGHPYDLVLMDMQMPRMDGLTATRQLRGAGYRHPIVALTAHSMADQLDRCLEAGCDAFIGKPLEQSHFFTTLHGILHKN